MNSNSPILKIVRDAIAMGLTRRDIDAEIDRAYDVIRAETAERLYGKAA